ncbi:hypothetical protein [Pleomorphovibrio marinus]|uniref:hypothetical protein n=1 Tax=Pleomorphovibrio marinus TaxID=2164132 RepID=UPI000E0A1D4C|nr:hypothetical protein [Pleomorphovibrio marinus]
MELITQIGYKQIARGVSEGISSIKYQSLLKGLGLRVVAADSNLGNIQKELGNYFKTAEELGRIFGLVLPMALIGNGLKTA